MLDGGEYAGSVTLRMTEPEIGTGEVGYGLLPAFRGRGLMSRALRLVGRWALTEVGLDRVAAGVAVANTASLRTAEVAGFRREGVLRQGLPGPEGRYDIVLLSLLRDDLLRDDIAGD
ncbi:MAG: GNAT family N-acetyltransferase [Actinomycetota bacterium]|nr:GNAT family N-acetyltransferase [Actinomycetota bacterium]